MLRLLLMSGLIGLLSVSGGYAQLPEKKEPPKKEPEKGPPTPKEPKDPKKPEEPEKPKDEPKKPKDEPKKPDEPKTPKEPKDPKKPEEPKKPEGKPAASAKAESKRPSKPTKPGEPKKYDEVITKEAKTQTGLFAVHDVESKIYFEIPQDELGRLMLWRAEVAQGPNGISFNGQELGSKFIRFERRENTIYIYEADYDKRAKEDIQKSVQYSRSEPILAAFNIEAEGKDRSAVILVNSMILSDSLGLNVNRSAGGGTADSSRSFLNEIKAYPKNIEARATLTFRGGSSGGGAPGGRPSRGDGNTALVHYSLTALPVEPMMGRYFDPRVGYFTESFDDYSDEKTWVVEKQFIARFRLEKKDPKAKVSEPVEPIVFYVAPEVPERWRDAVKKGIEDWQPAFEKAGFKNAIIAKDPPSRAEDPDWSPEDARHNVIRWVAEPVSNAMGPHVHDPRSGEIISAHIIMWHDVLKLAQMWYFVQCSAQDAKAQELPLPEDLTARLLRYVVCHEVGHTIGLRHNHRASQAYSTEQLRDPEFVKKFGSVASIMSYGRFNYVAQPEDNIPAADLVPQLGPYDFFAIEWGYTPLPDAKTPAEETKTLDEWAARQIDEPFLRFGGEDGPSTVDPSVLTENIGADRVQATELGFKNLDRVMGYLVKATTEKGENFDILDDAYGQIMSHRSRWLDGVLKLVGGVVENRTLAGRGVQFERVPKEDQKEAVAFILKDGFHIPKEYFSPAVVNQFTYSGVANKIISQQRSMLRDLLASGRLGRLVDAEIQNPDTAYTISELVDDVQKGVWEELDSDTPKIDPIRRDLQRTYLSILQGEFKDDDNDGDTIIFLGRGRIGNSIQLSELRAIARINLKKLAKKIEATLPKTKDAITKAHLQDSLDEINSVFKKEASE